MPEPVTLTSAILAAAGSAVVGAIGPGVQIIENIRKDTRQRKTVRQNEAFNQALIAIEEGALGSAYAMQNYQNLMQENVALGNYSSSLSKSRIGFAGTSNQGVNTIMGQYQMQRNAMRQAHIEKTAQLQIKKLSSIVNMRTNEHISVPQRVVGLMQEFVGAFGETWDAIQNGIKPPSPYNTQAYPVEVGGGRE